MRLDANKFIYITQEELDSFFDDSNTTPTPRILNLGDVYFYPPTNLQENLESVLVFAENTKKRGIPSGSVWKYTEPTFKPEILRDDVGCGITVYLAEKGITNQDFLSISSQHDFGGGNHFLNKGSFDEELDYIMLHSDMNSEKRIPKSIQQAKNQVKTATNKRRELIEEISQNLGAQTSYFKDWPHNHIITEDSKVVYLKGVIDTKKTQGLGLLALTPQDGCALYAQVSNTLNGYMQHGLGVTNHKFLKEYSAVPDSKHRFYIPQDNSKVRESFNSEKYFGNKFYPRATLINRVIPPDISIRSR